MQLDRVPPRRPAPMPEAAEPDPRFPGTEAPPAGVYEDVRSGGDGGGFTPRRRIPALHRARVGLAAFALLGQGEPCVVDPRFATPSATLGTYWSALRDNDAPTLAECMEDGRVDQPFLGMLWFMPPTREIRLEEFRSLPVSAGRVLVSYQVRFRPTGAVDEQLFQTGHELVRVRGGWHIARGLGPASLPAWRPIPRSVDI